MAPRALRSALFAGGLLLSAVCALAATRAAEPRVSYGAVEGCPSAADFIALVHRRATHVEIVTGAADAHVEIVRTEGGWRGTLTYGESSDSERREVTGTTCADVTDAMAFAVAIALEPDASPAGASATSASSPPPPSSAAPATSATPTAPRPAPSAVPPEARRPSPSSKPHVETEERRHLIWGVGATAGAGNGVLDRAAFEYGAFADVGRLDDEGRGALARLTFVHGADSVEVGADSAQLSWNVFRLEACPWLWVPLQRLTLAPCATAGAGWVLARGSVAQPRQSTEPWVDLGLSADLELRPFRPVLVGIAAQLVLPMLRNTYEFQAPRETIVKTPTLAAAGLLRLGVRFP